MKPHNPAKAGFLNIVFPGLGCAYIGKWFYALAYLIWIPLVWIASWAVSSFLANLISDTKIRFAVFILLLFGFRIRILWDAFFTPYELAEEQNNKLMSKMETQATN